MENNLNSGALFINRKEKPSHPDYTGGINVDGKEYVLAAWKKVSRNGKEYLSIAISTAETRTETSAPGDMPEGL